MLTDLRIVHDGPCNYEDVMIPDDARRVCCLADNSAIMMPVCGTDNVTYPNPFILYCAKYRGVVSQGNTFFIIVPLTIFVFL